MVIFLKQLWYFPVNCFAIKSIELNHVGGGSTGITEFILGNIVILVVVILPINETAKFIFLCHLQWF